MDSQHRIGHLALNVREGESILCQLNQVDGKGNNHEAANSLHRCPCTQLRITLVRIRGHRCSVLLEGCPTCHHFLRGRLATATVAFGSRSILSNGSIDKNPEGD